MIFSNLLVLYSDHHNPVLEHFPLPPPTHLQSIVAFPLSPRQALIWFLSLEHYHLWAFLIYGIILCRVLHSASFTQPNVSEVHYGSTLHSFLFLSRAALYGCTVLYLLIYQLMDSGSLPAWPSWIMLLGTFCIQEILWTHVLTSHE